MWVRRCTEALMRQGQRYLNDPDFRRQVLESSLVTPSNGYSQLRLMNYTESAWGSLPVRWPRVTSMKTECEVTSSESQCWLTPPRRSLFEGGPKRSSDQGTATPPRDRALTSSKVELWRAWGAWAFRAYPSQTLSEGWPREFNPTSVGLSVYQGETIGLVWASNTSLSDSELERLKEGPIELAGRRPVIASLSPVDDTTSPPQPELSLTCAACHASLRLPNAPLRPINSVKLFTGHPDAVQFEDAYVAWGLNNPWFDLRDAIQTLESGSNRPNDWGPGRADVTNDRLMNPTVYGDLRPISMQSHLHRAGTLINHPLALAVRIETLLITSFNQRARPPRWLCWALALYLWDLVAEHEEREMSQEEGAEPQSDRGQVGRGEVLFERHCTRCHMGEGLSGPPVLLSALGDPLMTDEMGVAESLDRGTGRWRVPSLWGAHQRVWLLSQGQVYGLTALLERMSGARGDEALEDRFRGAHAFPLSLSSEEIISLSTYLESVGPGGREGL